MVADLEVAGRMTADGRVAFNARPVPESISYTYQSRQAALDAASIKVFKKNWVAWDFFEAQPPSYRQKMAWWVVAATQEETRERRLQ
ncbi:MAG: YdeI/OmpD-associated family protein [Planctomycetia bacterium]|nr:YdeI/OmpD-associated family protein [Planctomycetia bacterium]MCC7315922.1 YdeI/OmpD-associated family protein [Planctomycetota bacterium]OQZ06833.1 MAG: hypothetical protein B6D36_02975 [Planctomycetes bacterium UTPLA1]